MVMMPGYGAETGVALVDMAQSRMRSKFLYTFFMQR